MSKTMRRLIGIGVLTVVILIGILGEAEIVKMPSKDFEESLTQEEYLEALRFVLESEKRVGEFWMADNRRSNILALAATQLRIKEASQKELPKDFIYKLIHLRNNKYYAGDFIIYRENLPIIILNITVSGKILVKPDPQKFRQYFLLPVETDYLETGLFVLLVNLYDD